MSSNAFVAYITNGINDIRRDIIKEVLVELEKIEEEDAWVVEDLETKLLGMISVFKPNKKITEAKVTKEGSDCDSSVKAPNVNLKNKGTGAGGANTNKNGLQYEKKSDLSSLFTVIQSVKQYSEVTFNTDKDLTPFIYLKKKQFLKYLSSVIDKSIPIAHGCKEPDECYINEKTKTIFIIEKKYQQTTGSVCEKLQSAPVKKKHLLELFPTYNTVYIFCLSSWFKENCKLELSVLEEHGIPVFWGDSLTYKQDIIDYIVNF
jgi:hypothetical protein